MLNRFFAKNNKRWMVSVVLMIGLALLVAVATLMLYRSSSDENQSDTQTVNEELSEEPLSPDETFVAQKFYDGIENSMSLTQLNQLAGKTGECASTGVYPSPTIYTCSWSDNDTHFIRVTFDENGVVSKDLIRNK